MPTKIEISLIIKKFDKKLEQIIQEDLPILKKIKIHVIESGGKRIRPLIHYFLTQLYGYKGKYWLDVGAIAELIHGASLLHDDVVDLAELRRGKPTVGKLYGNKTAILAGDYLLACGIHHLNQLHSPALMDSFTQVIRDLAVGELIQMEWEKSPKITMEIYNKIIYGKTASLFGAVGQTAGILCELSSKEISILYKFGITLGMLFQKKDDFIDYFQESKDSGKTSLKDFQNGLFTYPVILLLENCNSSEKKQVIHLITKPEKSQDDEKEILDWMKQKQIKEKILDLLKLDLKFLLDFMKKFEESSIKKIMIEKLEEIL
jgi:octaprenyl-diphosphate synthase